MSNNIAGTAAAVYQFSTGFAGGGTGNGSGTLGSPSNTRTVYSGNFDNIYMISTAANPTGNIYVCGHSGDSLIPMLWQVPILNNAIQTPIAGPALAGNALADCSPVTEILNGSTDRIFVGVTTNNVTGSPISCPAGNGCLMSFDVTLDAPFGASKATSGHILANGGTSGVIIDNTVGSGTLAGASQVYFSTLSNQACVGNGSTGSGSGGCAVQASQAGLN